MSEIHDVENYYLAPLPPMSLSQGFPLVARSKVPLPGYQGGTVGEDHGLYTGSPVLGREIQPAYARLTMPLGREHPQIEGDDGALCFLLWWHHPGWCSPTGRVSWGLGQHNCFWECPASLHQHSHQRGCCGRSSHHWGASWGTNYSPDTMWRADKGRGFPNLRKVLHPSWPVTTTGQTPLVPHKLRQRPHSWSSGERGAWSWRVEECQQVKQAEWDSTSPPGPLEAVQEVVPPPGFKEVMACLQRDPSPATTFEAPLEPMQLEAIIKPAVAMMYPSRIVQDEATGITYMDTVTTSVGQVVLGGPQLATQTPRLTIEDVTNLPYGKRLITTFGQKNYDAIWQEHSHVLLWL